MRVRSRNEVVVRVRTTVSHGKMRVVVRIWERKPAKDNWIGGSIIKS